jgi:hypothetical protein
VEKKGDLQVIQTIRKEMPFGTSGLEFAIGVRDNQGDKLFHFSV